MNHFKQIAGALTENGLDAVMLTAAPNRLYASGFRSSAGLVLVTREKAWFFTDSRYIEAATRGIRGADVELVSGSRDYLTCVREIVEANGISNMGFEEDRMPVASWEKYRDGLPCRLTGAGAMMDTLRAVKDAERFAEEDKKLKEAVETKNQAETMIFQCEKTLGELGDKVDEAMKAPVTAAIEKLKETVKGNDTEAIKADTEALQQAFYPLAEKLYQAAQAAGGAQGAGFDPNAGAQGGDGTYYNADFEDKSDN